MVLSKRLAGFWIGDNAIHCRGEKPFALDMIVTVGAKNLSPLRIRRPEHAV